MKRCSSYWREKGVDLNVFTADARADDVEALRQALGAERVNVLAFSYGTEVARNLFRRYPRSIDRVVLDGTDENPVPSTVFDEITVDGHTYRVGKAAMQLIITRKIAEACSTA